MKLALYIILGILTFIAANYLVVMYLPLDAV